MKCPAMRSRICELSAGAFFTPTLYSMALYWQLFFVSRADCFQSKSFKRCLKLFKPGRHLMRSRITQRDWMKNCEKQSEILYKNELSVDSTDYNMPFPHTGLLHHKASKNNEANPIEYLKLHKLLSVNSRHKSRSIERSH
jgi:hypothetical protein